MFCKCVLEVFDILYLYRISGSQNVLITKITILLVFVKKKKKTSKKTTLSHVFLSNKDEITEEKLSSAKVFVIAGPRDKFTAPEVCTVEPRYKEVGCNKTLL